jgi:hypothetical protein
MSTKWVQVAQSSWGLSRSIVFFSKVNFYAGKTDHWGIGFDINFHDRALTFEILNVYFGVEIWHKEIK